MRGRPARGIALQIVGERAGRGGELDREAVAGVVEPRRTAPRVASQIRAVGPQATAGETRRQGTPRSAERDRQGGDPGRRARAACRRCGRGEPVGAIGDAVLGVAGVVGRAARVHRADVGRGRQTAAVGHLGHGDVVRVIDENGVTAVAQRRPRRGLVEIRRVERRKHHASVVQRVRILGRQQWILGRAVVDDHDRAGGNVVPHRIVLEEQVVAARVLDVIVGEARVLQDEQLDPLAVVRALAEFVDDDRAGECRAHRRHVDGGLERVSRAGRPRGDRTVADADGAGEKRLGRRVAIAGPHRAAPEFPGIGRIRGESRSGSSGIRPDRAVEARLPLVG